eukprot:1778707-Ditylum_brightwellii.AAC.1
MPHTDNPLTKAFKTTKDHQQQEGGIQTQPIISSKQGRRRHPNTSYHLFKLRKKENSTFY